MIDLGALGTGQVSPSTKLSGNPTYQALEPNRDKFGLAILFARWERLVVGGRYDSLHFCDFTGHVWIPIP
jgi:hypothetical protein